MALTITVSLDPPATVKMGDHGPAEVVDGPPVPCACAARSGPRASTSRSATGRSAACGAG